MAVALGLSPNQAHKVNMQRRKQAWLDRILPARREKAWKLHYSEEETRLWENPSL